MRKKENGRWPDRLSGLIGQAAVMLLLMAVLASLVSAGKLGESALWPAVTVVSLLSGFAAIAASSIRGNRKQSLLISILGSAVFFFVCGPLLGRAGRGGTGINLLSALASVLPPLGGIFLGGSEGTARRKRRPKGHNR